MGWCGSNYDPWVAATLNPCFFNTAAAAALFLAAAATVLLKGGNARRLAAAAHGRAYLLQPTAGGVHAVQLAGAALLAGLHALVLLWVTTQVPQPPYVAFSESLLAAAWAAFAVGAGGAAWGLTGCGQGAQGCRFSRRLLHRAAAAAVLYALPAPPAPPRACSCMPAAWA